jgi:hypothetical protein
MWGKVRRRNAAKQVHTVKAVASPLDVKLPGEKQRSYIAAACRKALVWNLPVFAYHPDHDHQRLRRP